MDTSIGLLLYILGGISGALIMFAWMSDSKPLIEQFRELPDTPESRARGAGL